MGMRQDEGEEMKRGVVSRDEASAVVRVFEWGRLDIPMKD